MTIKNALIHFNLLNKNLNKTEILNAFKFLETNADFPIGKEYNKYIYIYY